jgi:hypothetical protein
MATRVFCIGNGESRKNFDLQSLRPYGKIYGCNALYRDFTPDVLTAVDHGIMHEIYHSGYCYNNETWLRDWTRVPAMMYDNLVYGPIDEETKNELSKFDIKKENKRTDEEEFVMHGSNLIGMATILKKNKETFLKQINQSNVSISWTKNNDKSHSLKEIMPDGKDMGWACGATSGFVACTNEKPQEVFLIGHDLNSTTGKINNVYKGSKHYGLPEAGPIPSVNWITQWKTLFGKFPKTTFYKVNLHNKGTDRVNTRIHEWRDVKNIKYINFEILMDLLNDTK